MQLVPQRAPDHNMRPPRGCRAAGVIDEFSHTHVNPKSHTRKISLKLLVLLVTGGCDSYARTRGTLVVLGARLSNRLIDAWLDIALRLATHGCQLRNNQVT